MQKGSGMACGVCTPALLGRCKGEWEPYHRTTGSSRVPLNPGHGIGMCCWALSQEAKLISLGSRLRACFTPPGGRPLHMLHPHEPLITLPLPLMPRSSSLDNSLSSSVSACPCPTPAGPLHATCFTRFVPLPGGHPLDMPHPHEPLKERKKHYALGREYGKDAVLR